MNELWKYPALVVGSVVCALLMVGSAVATFDLVRKLFDEALQNKNMVTAYQSCILMVVLFFINGIVTYGNRYYLRLATERVVYQLRSKLFERFTVFSHVQLSTYSSGQALGHIVNDVGVIAAGLHVVADLILSPLMIVGLLGYLLHLNWKLTIFCMLALPPVGWVGKRLGRSARRNQSRIQDALQKISSHIIDSFRGLRTAHAFNRSRTLRDDFSIHNQKNLTHSVRLASIEEVVAPLTKWVTTIAGAGIISFGAYLVIVEKSLTAGELIAFVTAAGGIIQPLRQLNTVNVRLQSVFAAGQRIKDVLEEKLDPLGNDQNALLNSSGKEEYNPQPVLSLTFENVSFQYPSRLHLESSEKSATPIASEEWALKNIQLKINAGESVALVGTSGSGKSTLSLIALRFVDPSQGKLLLNGRDARELPLDQFRAHFSYVSQDVHLFQRSLRENLLFAKTNATESEIWSALERASIADFVKTLPNGLDTELGEQASKISGGERQRLGIARAFLRNSPILVLDEITSQLDSKSEEKIQSALKELFVGRTVIMIAHRLTTIREADRVVVMELGHIIEEGSPQELIDRPGSAFGGFWKSQHRHSKEARG